MISPRCLARSLPTAFLTGAGAIALVAATSTPARCRAAGPPQIAEVRPLGKLFQPNPVNITGQDAATSIPLASGDALWLFGDTIEGPFNSIRGLTLADKLSNTAALVPAQEAVHGLRRFSFFASADGRRPREVLEYIPPEERSRQRLWPMHGVGVGDQVYVYYHRISLLPGVDVFENFKLEGMGLAQARIGQWKFRRLTAAGGGREFWTGDQPTFGVFVTPRENRLYVWGSLMTGAFLARTEPSRVADLESYEYLVAAPQGNAGPAAARWSKTFAPTAPLFDGVPNEMSVSYNTHLGCFLAVHTYLRERRIVLRTAPDIAGPWSDPVDAYAPPSITKDELFYAAKEHPELARDGGRQIYVTYINSATYVPELIEITFR